MTEPLNRQLAHVIGEFEQVTAGARRLAESQDGATFERRPAPERWSPAECFAHLTITTDVYLPLIRGGVAEGRALPPARGRYRSDFKGWLLARSLEPSGRFKIKTPRRFEPVDIGGAAQVIADFERSQDALAALVRESSGLDLRRVRIASPFNARMTYNLFACYKIMAAHERRHLAQAGAAAA